MLPALLHDLRKSTSTIVHADEENMQSYSVGTSLVTMTQVVALKNRKFLCLRTQPSMIIREPLQLGIEVALPSRTWAILDVRRAVGIAAAAFQLGEIRFRHALAVPHQVGIIKFERRGMLVIDLIDDGNSRRARYKRCFLPLCLEAQARSGSRKHG